MMSPNRSEASLDSFDETGTICKKRVLLEFESRFFNNESEATFAENNAEFCTNSLGRERALLLLDKRACLSRSDFDDNQEWSDCQNELKCYFLKHNAQEKVRVREKQREADENE